MLKRKSFLISLLFLPNLVLANNWWQNLWFNNNQQGMQLLKENKNQEAALKFSDHNWKGLAYYRDKQYAKAYQEFAKDNSARGLYNQGNALAYQQKYAEAIKAYKQALSKNKNYPDASHNIQILEKLLQNQQPPKQDEKQQQSAANKEKQQKQQTEQNKTQQNQQQTPANEAQQNQHTEQNKTQQNQQQTTANEAQQKQQTEQNKTQQKQPQTTANDKQQKQQIEQNRSERAEHENGQQKQHPEQQAAPNKAQQSATTQGKEVDPLTNAKKSEKNSEKTKQIITDKQIDNKEKQEIDAILSQIPDDPGGLLKNKFARDYQKEQQGNTNE